MKDAILFDRMTSDVYLGAGWNRPVGTASPGAYNVCTPAIGGRLLDELMKIQIQRASK